MKRIGYIDALRGLAMLLVVMGHVIVLAFEKFETATLTKFVYVFHVPLFFFISGFLAHKSMNGMNSKQFFSGSLGKIRELLIPTLLFLFLYYDIINPHSASSDFISIIKTGYFGGYWFTITLFIIFVVYYVTCYLGSTNKLLKFTLLGFLFFVSFICPIVIYKIYPHIVWRGNNPFVLADAYSSLQYFLIGAFAGYSKSIYHRLNESNWFKAIAIVGFVLSVAFDWQYDFASAPRLMKWAYSLNGMLTPYFGLFTCVIFFYNIKDYFETDALWSRMLKWIGRRTLDVYLIHYFFIGNFTIWSDLITPDNILLEIIISFSLSMVIIALSILVGNVIRSSSVLATVVLGAKPIRKLSKANL